MPETIVLLHGFAGTGRMWEPVLAGLDPERYRPLAPDLRGHGTASAARPVTFDAVVADVLAAAPLRFALAGYSMGGRIALHVALAAPERISRLVLVATTAGIEDDAQRAERRAADEALARRTEHGSIETFAAAWTAQPLFAGTPRAAAAQWREDILRNDPAGLAAALRGLGAGAMPPLWDRLPELTMPALVLAGDRDPRYTQIAHRLTAALPASTFTAIPSAGHGLPREAPEAVARALAGV